MGASQDPAPAGMEVCSAPRQGEFEADEELKCGLPSSANALSIAGALHVTVCKQNVQTSVLGQLKFRIDRSSRVHLACSTWPLHHDTVSNSTMFIETKDCDCEVLSSRARLGLAVVGTRHPESSNVTSSRHLDLVNSAYD